MDRLTDDQRRTLAALCLVLVPAGTPELPRLVEERIADLAPQHRRRARLALRLFGSAWLALVLLAVPRPFAALNDRNRSLLLERCAGHRSGGLRLLYSSVRRLIMHTYYGGPGAATRNTVVPWAGPLAGAGPLVADQLHGSRTRPALPNTHSAHQSSRAVKARVCIIGSGVGGAMAAAQLAEAGCDVVVLESGGYHHSGDFGTDETHAFRTLYADRGLRMTDALNVSILQGHNVGGGSTVNWMIMLRTPDRVIDEWQQHGLEGMDRAALHAAFDEFERDSSVQTVPDTAHSPVNRLLLDGAATLGWRAHAARLNARGCRRAGVCGFGCPHDAKQSAQLTYLARAVHSGAQLIYDAPVSHIERNGKSFRVHAGTADITAEIVVVAAGAVGTPVLLQASGVALPALGSHLRLHPTTVVLGIYDQPIGADAGIPLSTYCDEFGDLEDGHGHWIETPPLSTGFAAVGLPGFGASHRRYMAEYAHIAPFIVLVRDGAPRGPSRGSVRLRAGEQHIRYALGAADRRLLRHGMESAARIHFANGARRVLTLHTRETVLHTEADLRVIHAATRRLGDPALYSAHVNGTARLGGSPRTSVCRPDGQVHAQPGLYVMDGSLLPTAPGVNPHETIAAVTMILARRLAAELAPR